MYAIVDCNNFYASCEEVFNPKLGKKPLVILSNNDGIVIARSAKAKAIGIEMGAPAYHYKEQIKSGMLAALSCNFALYADMSQRVMQVLESFSPDMEIYSIDEAFFQLSEDKPVEKAVAIRKIVKQWTGITTSIGIAPTKTLAKLANRSAKKSDPGVFLLSSPEEIRKKLETTPLEDIWGIGKATALQLKRKNIHLPAHLCDREEAWIRQTFGVVVLRTALELKGIPCIEFLEENEKKQSISCTRSFSQSIESLDTLQVAVASFAARASEKLREQKSKARFISVFLATNRFVQPYGSAARRGELSVLAETAVRRSDSLPIEESEILAARSWHRVLPNATSYTPDLIVLAKEGISRILRRRCAYKRAGVLLGDFVDEGIDQMDLLSPQRSSEKKLAAMKVFDQINTRYDKSAIRFLAEEKKYIKGHRENVSPRYTTDWNDLLEI